MELTFEFKNGEIASIDVTALAFDQNRTRLVVVKAEEEEFSIFDLNKVWVNGSEFHPLAVCVNVAIERLQAGLNPDPNYELHQEARKAS